MPAVIPYIPEAITVHLGAPGSNAANVTVSFPDYVKNVAASEIYPTWEESALRANILAIISFALNRVYTEFYRSRGYPYEITSSTAYDQKFINGRNFFEDVSRIVDQIFNSYLRRPGFVEPLAAKFCNGTTVTCEGLSQWGSQYLAQQGYNSLQILRNYYGSNIEIVNDAPIQGITESYPGTALRVGSTGSNVTVIQVELNRISQNYPAIPKVQVDGIFGSATENAVRAFQQIFDLQVDGIVGRATWYKLVMLYVGVLNLAELRSEGQRFYGISWAYPDPIQEGDTGEKVSHLQYMLAVISEFVPEVPPVRVTGTFDTATKNAVMAFQGYMGLQQTGLVGDRTWDEIYDQFAGIENAVLSDREVFPPIIPQLPQTTAQNARARLHTWGYTGNGLQQELAEYQSRNGLVRNGRLTPQTAQSMDKEAERRRYERTVRITQYPGYPLGMDSRDHVVGGRV